MKTVREIMSPIVFSIEETAYLPEAAAALRKYSISGAPVINANKQYVGVVSQTDINGQLAGFTEGEASLHDMLEGGFPPDIQAIRVKDIMTPQLLRISAESSLEELGQSLLISGVHRLLVADEGEIVGLVSTTDLIHGFLSPEPRTATAPKRPKRKPYLFETDLSYDQGLTRVQCASGPELVLEAPVEFGGKGEHCSPEDLFVSSISSCLCLTFMDFCDRAKIEVLSYKCRAIGRLEGDGVSQRFTRVDLYPIVNVRGLVEKAEQALNQAKLRCLVGRSSDVVAVLHSKIVSSDIQEN